MACVLLGLADLAPDLGQVSFDGLAEGIDGCAAVAVAQHKEEEGARGGRFAAEEAEVDLEHGLEEREVGGVESPDLRERARQRQNEDGAVGGVSRLERDRWRVHACKGTWMTLADKLHANGSHETCFRGEVWRLLRGSKNPGFSSSPRASTC